jgi:eukaryotic-like serine/threonine-protein kinase
MAGILAYVHRPALLKPVEVDMNDDAGREMAVFTGAIKVPLRDRNAFLDIACDGDEGLRQKVEALLKAHDRIGNFLEDPPTEESIE